MRQRAPERRQDKLWSPGFITLWQSQLVSSAGDAVYGIALGFWVLSETGSTALMGALLAASTLPGVLVAPFAGVLVDRADKKRLLVLMDFIRAAAVVLLAAAAYGGLIRLWMVFGAGILLSLCGAVFTPCVQTVIPQIAPPTKIPQANSAFSAVNTGSGMIGNTAGGFLYQLLGAPTLFLINGLSFLYSCVWLLFVKLPKGAQTEKQRFISDMAEGFGFILREKGLRLTAIVAAVGNFFYIAAHTLFLPLCEFSGLGAGRYGILMACYSGGALMGYVLLSAVAIRAKERFRIFAAASFLYYALLIILINQPYFIAMAAMMAAAGALNAAFNVILISAVQMATPEGVRGKVLSFVNMAAGGLAPLAMAAAGVLGEVLPVRFVMSAAYALSLAATLPTYFYLPFKTYITTDYAASAAGQANLPDSENIYLL